MKLLPWAVEAYAVLALLVRFQLWANRQRREFRRKEAWTMYNMMLDREMAKYNRKIRLPTGEYILERELQRRLQICNERLRKKVGDDYYAKHYAGKDEQCLADPWYQEVLGNPDWQGG